MVRFSRRHHGHMPRALADLRGKLPFRTIVPYPIFDDPASDGRQLLLRFVEYLVSLVASRLPTSVDPRDAGLFDLFWLPSKSLYQVRLIRTHWSIGVFRWT